MIKVCVKNTATNFKPSIFFPVETTLRNEVEFDIKYFSMQNFTLRKLRRPRQKRQDLPTS